ncbi:MAG TPA: NHLP bacteriocin system secretion protein [Kouleothrix sp.]|uniref:NHLP bacteriocin system secretion protein n=1 Tax=Kouleothrix sp. TaxID=2779161 RepID=UPI002B680638|nr:NHLP bacteriocin system secretion protein [Kouleothrix sp.]HRC75932.1 NHLP bacteriocin system secretion protein [Kouleothrix sp.]
MQKPIFRKVALERLSSPEQLDQLMRVTTARGWLALLALLALIITLLAWSFNDTIPTQTLGRGILLRGGHLARVVPQAAGQVTEVLVRPGDLVQPGQALVKMAPTASGGGLEMTQSNRIVSAVAGRVVDISVAPGSLLSPGVAIASIEDTARPLEAVIYMPAASGANVQPGMQVQVSPANLSREEYGFIRGRVASVASFPATFESMMLVLANEQLVREFLAGGTPIEVRIALEPDASTASGYRWSSSAGPPAPINSGTLAQATITLAEQRPINLVFPVR